MLAWLSGVHAAGREYEAFRVFPRQFHLGQAAILRVSVAAGSRLLLYGRDVPDGTEQLLGLNQFSQRTLAIWTADTLAPSAAAKAWAL